LKIINYFFRVSLKKSITILTSKLTQAVRRDG